MNIRKEAFGELSTGEKVTKFTLGNNTGLTITAIDYGAILTSVVFPDRKGNAGEITLGFDSIEGYEGANPYFGATIGRYANRISGGGFALAGKTYRLAVNDSGVHLHGGKAGFNRKMWSAEIEAEAEKGMIKFHRVSADGEENYPGNLDVTLVFTLTENNELCFEYTASTDKYTPVNLTNHTYWNLGGPGNPVYDHLLAINADRYLETDEKLLPTGKFIGVKNTPMDFTKEKPIGRDLAKVDGYDHCFALLDSGQELTQAAVLKDPVSGRCMSIETNQPAIQFYTANMLKDMPGRGGVIFRKHGAVCLETGAYNNSINIPEFPDTVLKPGDMYRHVTRHTFRAE
ncbi:MAG: galactose mutarotase [Spirochaetales bacterium]|nr:galactose mutarotase [Spirochaetales bacterium]